jgi:hypothetical protein
LNNSVASSKQTRLHRRLARKERESWEDKMMYWKHGLWLE